MIVTPRKCVVAMALLAAVAPFALASSNDRRGSSASSTPSLRKGRSLMTGSGHRAYARSLVESTGGYEYDPEMVQYMDNLMVKKMSTQNMVDETLVLNGEVISFADEYLEMIRVRTDRSKSNQFYVNNGGREYSTTADNTIRTNKRNGIVKKASMRIKSTKERIDAIRMRNGKYAVISTNDIDNDALEKLGIDSVEVYEDDEGVRSSTSSSTRNIHQYSMESGGSRRQLVDENGCDGYKVIRMNARFDSEFCNTHGGNEGNTIDDIETIVVDINEFYETTPGLCMKVQLCGASGFCDPNEDELESVIDNSVGFCGGDGTLISNFRSYVHPNGTFSDVYENGECDTTHLFFGGGNNQFTGGTIGCAYVGALCRTSAAGVNNVGRYTSNAVAQAVLVAHELGHNAQSNHDDTSVNPGFIMGPSLCASCDTFSPQSVTNMTNYVNGRDTATCIGYEPSILDTDAPTDAPTDMPTDVPTDAPTDMPVIGATNSPTSTPTDNPTRTPSKPPTAFPTDTPTSSPTRAPVPAPGPTDCSSFSRRGACNNESGGQCSWISNQCMPKAQLSCSDFNKRNQCRKQASCDWQSNSCVETGGLSDWTNVCAEFTAPGACNNQSNEVCTWIAEDTVCWPRSEMDCDDYTRVNRCVFHGTDCAWDSLSGTCVDDPF